MSGAYSAGMTPRTLDRTNWREAIDDAGISLASLSRDTSRSFSAIYKYSTGKRRPPEEWLREVEQVLADRPAHVDETERSVA